jgi:hypothetical protein
MKRKVTRPRHRYPAGAAVVTCWDGCCYGELVGTGARTKHGLHAPVASALGVFGVFDVRIWADPIPKTPLARAMLKIAKASK